MTANDLMERADRAVILCHAIRHLLDHTNPFPREWVIGDTDAIHVLQYAFDGPEPRCDYEYPESSVGACDGLPCGLPATKQVGEFSACAKHMAVGRKSKCASCH